MEIVFDHYVKHHKVVLTKLGHAQSATAQSIQEINNLREQFELEDDTKNFSELQKYDAVWETIIQMFRRSGVSEEELAKIENILLTIPKAIRQYYDLLIQQDRMLQALIAELKHERYEKARAEIAKVQNFPDMMSGLPANEFEPINDHKAELIESDLIFKISRALPDRSKGKKR